MNDLFNDYLENSLLSAGFSDYSIKKTTLNYVPYFPENKNAKVLDIGVGNGEPLALFRDFGYVNYYGVDISRSAINACQKQNLQCELVEDTVAYLNNHPNEYELITLFHVLEHIPKNVVIDFCKAINNALAPNGKVVIEVPSIAAYSGIVTRYVDFTHELGLGESSLYFLLKSANFSHIKIANVEGCIGNGVKHYIRKFFRKILHLRVRFWRRIDGWCTNKYLNIFICAIGYKN